MKSINKRGANTTREVIDIAETIEMRDEVRGTRDTGHEAFAEAIDVAAERGAAMENGAGIEKHDFAGAVSIPEAMPVINHGKVVNFSTARALEIQYNKCTRAIGSATLEMCRFGAMLEMVDDALTTARYSRSDLGNGQGESLKSWLAENCPAINYKTAKNYQYAAQGIRKLIALSAEKPLLDYMGKEPLAVEADEEIRQKIIETINMSSMNVLRLACGGNGLKGLYGVSKGRHALTAEEKAEAAEKMMRQIVGAIGAYLRGPWLGMLEEQSQTDFMVSLKHYEEVIKEKIMER